MRITIRNGFSAGPRVNETDWPALVGMYNAWAGISLSNAVNPKEKPADLPLVGFCAFDAIDANGEGCRRKNINPEGLWGIALDFDDTPQEDFAAVLARAQSANAHGLAHTTWKQGLGPSGTVRTRLVLPFDAPLPISLWEIMWEQVVRELGADVPGLDKACKNPERLWYLPVTNEYSVRTIGEWTRCWVHSW